MLVPLLPGKINLDIWELENIALHILYLTQDMKTLWRRLSNGNNCLVCKYYLRRKSAFRIFVSYMLVFSENMAWVGTKIHEQMEENW